MHLVQDGALGTRQWNSRPKAENVLFIWATLFYHGYSSVERAGSPDQRYALLQVWLRFARATPIFSLFMNAEKHLHLGSLFLTFKLKQWLPILHNGMTSRNGSADSTGIDPAGRQETQTDDEHVIRGATLTQQAGSMLGKHYTLPQWAPKDTGRGSPAVGLFPGVMWHEHGVGHYVSQVPRQRMCRARASDPFWQGPQSLF